MNKSISSMAKEMLSVITKYGDATIPKMMERLRNKGYNPDGNKGIALGGDVENVYIWIGVSEEFHNALNELIDAKLVIVERAHVAIFMCDGDPVLNLPLVGIKIPKNGYKKPRWIPLIYKANGSYLK